MDDDAKEIWAMFFFSNALVMVLPFIFLWCCLDWLSKTVGGIAWAILTRAKKCR